METFQDPKKLSCFLVTDPCSWIAVQTALQYWGCATTQAGIYVAGVLYPCIAVGTTHETSTIEERCSPLRISGVPFLSFESSPDWDETKRSMSRTQKTYWMEEVKQHPSHHQFTFD
jgi:hypothetical protein